jgi:DNA-binding transcriptional MerR regulator
MQQILFYRALGVPLEDIRSIICSKDFDGKAALASHLSALHAKRRQLDSLIANVEKTIQAEKGEVIMSDMEKFEGFKQKLINGNEEQYGTEVRAIYGDDTVNKSNARIKGMSKEQHAQVERLSLEVNKTLKAAFEQGDPASGLAQKACELHQKWLCCFWSEYSKEAHIGITQMYVDDPRFTAYYDKIAVGCAKFLRDAVLLYCK